MTIARNALWTGFGSVKPPDEGLYVLRWKRQNTPLKSMVCRAGEIAVQPSVVSFAHRLTALPLSCREKHPESLWATASLTIPFV
jgi:hypothetical protein